MPVAAAEPIDAAAAAAAATATPVGSANFGPNPPSSADGRPVKMYCRVHKAYHACEWTRLVAAGAPPPAAADIEDLPMPLKRFSVKARASHVIE